MLTFDEPTHTYRFDGKVIPSVTTILSAEGAGVDYSTIPAAVLKRAADVGTEVHHLAESHLLHGTELWSMDKRVMMYLNGVRNFLDSGVVEVLETEQQLCCTKYWIAGTVDLFGFVNGELAVLDWKTTSKLHTDTVELQLALYQYMKEIECGEEIPLRYAVHLKDTKTGYALVKLDKNPRARVEALRMVHNYNKRMGFYE